MATQQWTFDNNSGSITNDASSECPTLTISSSKEKSASRKSIYFALQKRRTQLAIGVASDKCKANSQIEVQELVYGSPKQQFVYIKDKKNRQSHVSRVRH